MPRPRLDLQDFIDCWNHATSPAHLLVLLARYGYAGVRYRDVKLAARAVRMFGVRLRKLPRAALPPFREPVGPPKPPEAALADAILAVLPDGLTVVRRGEAEFVVHDPETNARATVRCEGVGATKAA